MIAVALSIAVVGLLAAQQPAHEGHAVTSTQAKPSMKMSMPALDDAHFVAMMRKHHLEGIEMSKLEESKGARAEVKTLAAKIRSAT